MGKTKYRQTSNKAEGKRQKGKAEKEFTKNNEREGTTTT
jgi:hypothetical protein